MIQQQLWDADPNNAKRLEAILADPVLQQAVALLASTRLPSGMIGGANAADQVTAAAHAYHYISGFQDCLKELFKLSKPKGPESKPLEQFDPEWMEEWAKKQAEKQTKEKS